MKLDSQFGSIYTALALFALIVLSSCQRGPTLKYLKGDTMGTFYTIQYWDPNSPHHQIPNTEIDLLLEKFENQLSNWIEDSWINQFNAAPANLPVPVPEHAFPVVALSLDLAVQSDGAFDPTLSPLIELWGFGVQRDVSVPDESEIQRVLQSVGYEMLVLDRESRTLLKTRDDIHLNCSAVAKGYAVDLVAQYLEENHITHFLVNIGGEVSARGTNPDGQHWRVGIHQPRSDGGVSKSEEFISLRNQSLATSGHGQRYFIHNDVRYSHILNSNTGFPVSTDTASVTVVAPTCALADGIATLAHIVDSEQLNQVVAQYDGIEIHRTRWSENEEETIPESR